MLISDHIARLIETLIEESGGTIELKRNDMAEQLGCAPSQINYVITSRFTPDRGYLIESRRGGGGYIRIIRKALQPNDYATELFRSVGDQVDTKDGLEILRRMLYAQLITEREAYLLGISISPSALSSLQDKQAIDRVRADVLRQVLLSVMK